MVEKISVIMPLYNAAVYLRESLESVLSQTFTQFELICINDASTDKTGDILIEYQKKDSRIKVLTNMIRSGAAYCRNMGIKAANGEYLSFLDGDDIFEEEMLEIAYQTAVDRNAEIVIFNYRHVPTEAVYKKELILHSEEYQKRYCRTAFSILDKEPYEFIIWSASPCNKLYKKKFIDANELEFQSLPSSNDVYFVIMALLLARKITVLEDNRVMLYAREHSQLTRISYNRNPMCAYQALVKVKEELKKRGVFEKTAPYYFYHVFQQLSTALVQTKNNETAKRFYRFLQNEGIRKLAGTELNKKEYADEYIYSKINLFISKSFESEWYIYESILSIYLEKKQDSLKKLFLKYQENSIQAGVWGAGINGRILLRFCNLHHLKIDMLVDTDKNKQGKRLEGHLIANPENAYGSIRVMLVSPQFIYQEVQEKIRKHDNVMEAVDVLQFLNII